MIQAQLQHLIKIISQKCKFICSKKFLKKQINTRFAIQLHTLGVWSKGNYLNFM